MLHGFCNERMEFRLKKDKADSSMGGGMLNHKKAMAFKFGKKCPHCHEFKRKRIPRVLWMKLLMLSKYYMCDRCGFRFITVLNVVSLKRF